MQELLHKSQMNVITASIPSFKEIFKSNYEEKSKCYLQFRFIFNGMSFCSLDFPYFKYSIQNLVKAMQDVELDFTKITEDSALHKMLKFSTDNEEE